MTARRIPVFATIVVLAAAAIMVALGFWQLGRARERDELNARLLERLGLPAVEYPYRAPSDQRFLYRKLTARCEQVTGWETRGGETAQGRSGWRKIAICRAPEGRFFRIDMGIANNPRDEAGWPGGDVVGRGIREPDARGVLERLFGDERPRQLMLVSQRPASNLAQSKQPDPSEESNSSWSYMVQWFAFAATALVIYALALRKRWRGQ